MTLARARAVALLGAAATVAPLWWLAQASGVGDAALFATRFLPSPSTWSNFRAAFFDHGAWETLRAATAAALAVTLLVVACAAPAAYALARRAGKVLRAALLLFAAAAFAPPIAFAPALLRAPLDARDPAGLWPFFTGLTLPLAVLLLFVFYRRLPANLEAAAALDGARPGRLLVEILLPLSAPTLAAVGAVVFLSCWGEVLLATAAPGDVVAPTLAAALVNAHPPGSAHWGEANALAAVLALPALFAAWLLRRPLVAGVQTLVDAARDR